MRLKTLAAIALCLTFVTTGLAEQRVRRFNGVFARRSVTTQKPPLVPTSPEYHVAPQHRPRPYDYYRSVWPKYYGGFHARHINNYGYPSGAVGLRGSSWPSAAW